MASDFNDKSNRREDPFAATPQLEALKPLLTLAHRDGLCVLVLDINKAHLYGVVSLRGRRAPRGGAAGEAQRGRVLEAPAWALWHAPAALSWEEDYTERLWAEGLGRGKAAPTCFNISERAMRALVHDDGFVVAGPCVQVEHNKKKLQ